MPILSQLLTCSSSFLWKPPTTLRKSGGTCRCYNKMERPCFNFSTATYISFIPPFSGLPDRIFGSPAANSFEDFFFSFILAEDKDAERKMFSLNANRKNKMDIRGNQSTDGVLLWTSQKKGSLTFLELTVTPAKFRAWEGGKEEGKEGGRERGREGGRKEKREEGREERGKGEGGKKEEERRVRGMGKGRREGGRKERREAAREGGRKRGREERGKGEGGRKEGRRKEGERNGEGKEGGREGGKKRSSEGEREEKREGGRREEGEGGRKQEERRVRGMGKGRKEEGKKRSREGGERKGGGRKEARRKEEAGREEGRKDKREGGKGWRENKEIQERRKQQMKKKQEGGRKKNRETIKRVIFVLVPIQISTGPCYNFWRAIYIPPNQPALNPLNQCSPLKTRGSRPVLWRSWGPCECREHGFWPSKGHWPSLDQVIFVLGNIFVIAINPFLCFLPVPSLHFRGLLTFLSPSLNRAHFHVSLGFPLQFSWDLVIWEAHPHQREEEEEEEEGRRRTVGSMVLFELGCFFANRGGGGGGDEEEEEEMRRRRTVGSMVLFELGCFFLQTFHDPAR
ncbi:DEAD-box ATP-dependent RNA helicase 42, partial [Ophiophagus hannah]